MISESGATKRHLEKALADSAYAKVASEKAFRLEWSNRGAGPRTSAA